MLDYIEWSVAVDVVVRRRRSRRRERRASDEAERRVGDVVVE